MSYVPDFENDIFISYAHIDNQPLTKDQEGWIDSFHRALEIRLQELLGDRPKIWRDPKLQGNDVFSDTLVDQFTKAALLVSVFSPRYVKSDWCKKELQEFLQVAEKTKGLVVGNKARVFKVLKTLVPLELQPPEVQGMLGYEFYQVDKATGKPSEFRQEFGPEAIKNFWTKLDDLAWEIHQLLEALKKQNAGDGKQAAAVVEPSALSDKPAIYLAETSFDLKGERDKIKREFEHQGYTILPDKALPLEAEEFKTAVRTYLAQCKISIHLIGENYGIIPEGEFASVVHLQNELAAEHSAATTFARLIWMPVGLVGGDPRQQEFIKFLQNDPEAQKGADVLQVPLESLKTAIKDKLTAKPKPEKKKDETAARTGPLRLYLICDKVDLDTTSSLEGFLFDRGFEVFLPIFEEDESQMREAHKEQLLLCDAAVIYHGQASDNWVRSKMLDLIKAPGYGRNKPMLANLIYLDAPETPPKQRFRTHEAMVIKNFGAFSPEALAPFIDALKSAK
jgi:TIR domain/Domain of unknown function (DUF4062)